MERLKVNITASESDHLVRIEVLPPGGTTLVAQRSSSYIVAANVASTYIWLLDVLARMDALPAVVDVEMTSMGEESVVDALSLPVARFIEVVADTISDALGTVCFFAYKAMLSSVLRNPEEFPMFNRIKEAKDGNREV